MSVTTCICQGVSTCKTMLELGCSRDAMGLTTPTVVCTRQMGPTTSENGLFASCSTPVGNVSWLAFFSSGDYIPPLVRLDLSYHLGTPNAWVNPPFAYWISDENDNIPVVPHKGVAEASEYETYRRACLLWITDGRANPLILTGGCHLVGPHRCWM